jgi:hypothetical protein
MRLRTVLLVAFAALIAAQEAQEPFENDTEYPTDEEDDPLEGDEGFFESAARSPQWQAMVRRLRRSVDGPKLLRARRWSNIANGALLAATGPISLAISLFSFRLSKVLLSLYVTVFGGMLTGIELGLAPIAPWVATHFSYLSTVQGRTALIAFLGGLTWPLGRLGLVPAMLTGLNAVFNANFNRILAFVVKPESADDGDGVGGSGSGRGMGGDGGGTTDEAAADRVGVDAEAAEGAEPVQEAAAQKAEAAREAAAEPAAAEPAAAEPVASS